MFCHYAQIIGCSVCVTILSLEKGVTMDVEHTIRTYLPQVVHLSLATSRENKPWVCEVHYSYDDDLNLYYLSSRDRRHSQEVMVNEFVAGNIVTQHFLSQKVRGVYFEGAASILGNIDALHPAVTTYAARFGGGKDLLSEHNKPDGHAFYQIRVSTFYLFDSYESQPSQKYTLPWKG